MGRGRNIFLNSCARGWYFLHGDQIRSPRVKNIISSYTVFKYFLRVKNMTKSWVSSHHCRYERVKKSHLISIGSHVDTPIYEIDKKERYREEISGESVNCIRHLPVGLEAVKHLEGVDFNLLLNDLLQYKG